MTCTDPVPQPEQAQDQDRRALLKGVASALLLSLLPVGSAWAATIVAVRLWPAKDYTRVTLEHDNELKFSHMLVQNPHRLVVDIEGAELNTALKEMVSKVTPNDPYIAQVRVGQYKPRVVRMVFDLKAEVSPQVFSLQPIAEYNHRLVLDLYPIRPVDPLLALAQGTQIENEPTKPLESPKAEPKPAEPTRLDKSADAKPAESNKPPENKQTEKKVEPKPELKTDSKPDTLKEWADDTQDKVDKSGIADKSGMKRLVTIALDPGHGGEDPGATGAGGSLEKNVVLSIARRLKAKIETIPGMRVMLTRDDDYFVPLHVRVQKARRVQADLFVSIHADAFVRPEARGSSVFALSEKGASSSAAKWLADKENSADLIGGVNIRSRDQQLAHVLLDLSTTAQINDSLKLGRAVLNEIGQINALHKPQVEQASFAVLKAPDIPSILVETAFISNPEEEKRLTDDKYQDQMARAIVAGIQRYFSKSPPIARNKLT